MFVPCGLSSERTKRPFAYDRAFSSSSAGTGSAAILRSSARIVVDGLVDPLQVDARLRVERARVGVRLVGGEDVVGEAAPLAHLGEQARRHAAAEHGAQELDGVAVRMGDLVAGDAEAEMRLVGGLLVHA